MKLARNTKFWNGLDKQFTYYLEAENTSFGYFMVVCYIDKDFQKIKGIENKVELLNKKLNLSIGVIVIDATHGKTSASNL